MVRHQLFIGAALIAGAAIGYCLKPQAPAVPTPVAGVGESHSKTIEDAGDASLVAALRARVRELEAKLAKAHEGDDELVSNAVERLEVARKERERPPQSPRAWLENLKKNDPARYVQMTNSFARWRQNRKEQQEARATFLSTIDTSRMSASAKKTHDEYQELLAKREAIEEKLQNPDLQDDERREIMGEMFAIDRQMREASSSERQVLLGEVARAVGLEGEAATELVETVGDVYEATEGGRHGFHMPPPPGR